MYHCITCAAKTPHRTESHHSGERLPRCQFCGTWKPFFPRSAMEKAWRHDRKPPLLTSKRKLKKNPAPPRAVANATKLFEAFTGEAGDEIARVPAPKVPKVALAIGPVLLIGYETVRDGVREQYVHRFASHARPLLVASHDGHSVFLLGGAYTFTDRGIVDKRRRK